MTKIAKHISLLFGCVLVLFSCNSDDDGNVYGETNTDRYNQQEQEVYDLLQSSPEGWKMTYFTDDPRFTAKSQQLGGWTFIFKFTDETNVTMVSDYSQETLTPQESEYDVKLGSTTKLSFTTANWIHLLTDSANYPTPALEGYGYLGDAEFLYYGQEGEDLIFRSNREQIEIRFQKATAQDWADLELARQTGALLDNTDMQLEINQGGEISNYDISYSAATRFATNIEIGDLSFGIAPIPNGLKVVKPIPVGDQEATDFVYDAANSWFISELENGDTVKIILDEPEPTAHLFEDYNYSFQVFQGSPSLDSSGAFVTGFNEAAENIENNTNLSLFGFFLVTSNNTIQYIFIDENDEFVVYLRNITYLVDIPNDRIIISDNGGWEEPSHEALLQPLENIIMDSEGLRMIDTGNTFEGAPVFGFANYNDSNSVFYTYTI